MVQQKLTTYLIDRQAGDPPLITANVVTNITKNSNQRSQAQALSDNGTPVRHICPTGSCFRPSA